MFKYQTSTFAKLLLYMQPRNKCWKRGMHGTAATFGKIEKSTYIYAFTIASVLYDSIPDITGM